MTQLDNLVQELVEKTLGKQQLQLIQLGAETALLKQRVGELEARIPKDTDLKPSPGQ